MIIHKTVFISMLTALLFVTPGAAASRTETATYEVAFQNLNGRQADPVGITSDGYVDYGGVRFLIDEGETSIAVTVADAAGGAPYTVICQDADLDTICGEVGEPRVETCGGATLAIAATGGDVLVFVGLQSAVAPSVGRMSVTLQPCGSNVAVGTTGTVTAVIS